MEKCLHFSAEMMEMTLGLVKYCEKMSQVLVHVKNLLKIISSQDLIFDENFQIALLKI